MINKMKKFGDIKSKMLTKLTESYNSGNKNELKDLITKLKSNQKKYASHLLLQRQE